MRPVDQFGVTLYRAGIRVCPPAFQREFGPQMLLDFEDVCGDRDLGGGTVGRWRFHARLLTDLGRTVIRQWIRTGLPVIALLSMTAASAAMTVAVNSARYIQISVPETTADPEVLAVILFTSVLVVVLLLAILFAQWAAHPRLRRPGRPRRR